MFLVALLIITKTWRHLKSPLTDVWIKKLWYIYTRKYMGHKKEQNDAICSNMNATRDYHTK